VPNEVTSGENLYENEEIPPRIFDLSTRQKLLVSCFVLWIDSSADVDIGKKYLFLLSGIECP
jgi:hypothetical protein